MRDFLKLAGTLTVIACAASVALSVAYQATREVKERYDLEEQEAARREVLPEVEGAVFERVETDSVMNGARFVCYAAYPSEGSTEAAGYTFVAYGRGYSSTIATMVGVDTAFAVTGIRIISQRETPGLGTKIQEVASRNTLWQVLAGKAVGEEGLRPWFQAQFDGRDESRLRVVKSRADDGVLAVTGATISSEAVTGSVRRGIAMLRSIVAPVEAAEQGATAARAEPGVPTSTTEAAP